MAEIDTSSYPKATMPVSPLDMAQKFGNLQQQKLAIDQTKLDQANQGLQYLTRAMTALGPNASKDAYKAVGEETAKVFNLPPDMVQIWHDKVDAAPTSQAFYKEAMMAGADHAQRLALGTGINATQTDNAVNYQGKIDPMTGGFISATQNPVQLAPTQPYQNKNTLEKGVIGPMGPPGFTSSRPGGLPVTPLNNAPAAPAAVPIPQPRPSLPTTGPTGPTVQTGFDFNQRFAGGPVTTEAPPGVASAMESVGKQSGSDMAASLQKAGNIQADLQPDLAVLNIVKGKLPGDFGPGTDALNQIKKLAVTWLPNVDPKLINDSSDYDTVKKYLVQGARSAGNTGTNDQLAAAFDANPNTTMNTATIESIVKSRVALKKMEAAQALIADQQGVSPDQFSRWKALNQNTLDPRAFGLDMMDDNAKTKLYNSFGKIDRGSGEWIAKDKAHQREFDKFEKSASFAHDAGLIEPPDRK